MVNRSTAAAKITGRHILLLVCTALLFFIPAAIRAQAGFTNPLLPSGADPWCLYKDGLYYYTHTTGRDIRLWKTRDMAALSGATPVVVWTPPASGPYSREIWAPEIHFLRSKWYIYFAADNGDNNQHRLYVLENEAADPLQGEWTLKGELRTPGDRWAIDASVFEDGGQLYLVWSGWQGAVNGEQDIFIAKMKNPWTVEGDRVMLSAPQYTWERNGDTGGQGGIKRVYVNEGPEMLMHGDDLFLIYSASGCWTDTYSLGMLRAKSGSDLLHPGSWKKSPEPVFQQSKKNQVYATGHCSFFTSPDGKEDYILYHANSKPGQGCSGHRSPRIQRFSWKPDGSPVFGEPVPEGILLPLPSGTVYTGPGKHNPVLDLDFPDPTVIHIRDTFYAYGTQSVHEGKMVNIQVAASPDLLHWQYMGDALPQKPGWASHTQDFWAPHVLYDSALRKFVLFYCARSNDTAYNKCIGVALADKPNGPFRDMGHPLVCGKRSSNIDPMAFADPATGRKWLYWGSDFDPIRVRELADNWQSFREGTTERPLLFPGKEKQYDRLVEGAWVDYHDGKYYLYYSGDNCCGANAHYAVMVARSDNATGPFVRLGEFSGTGTSVILEEDSLWNAPGHNSLVKDALGNTWIAYHAIRKFTGNAGDANRKTRPQQRVFCINPVKYVDGWPVVIKYF